MMQNPKSWPVFMGVALLLILLVRPAMARDGKVEAYIFLGAGVDGYHTHLMTPEFRDEMQQACGAAKTEVIGDPPTKQTIVDKLQAVDIFYGNMHGGEDGGKHVLRTGAKGAADQYMTAEELRDLRRKVGADRLPKLMVLAACHSVENLAGVSLTIRDALGIDESTVGRTVIGFEDVTVGKGCDRYFVHVFKVFCTKRPDGTWPTIQEALDEGKKGLKDPTMFPNYKRLGDPNLTWLEVCGQPKAPGEVKASVPPGAQWHRIVITVTTPQPGGKAKVKTMYRCIMTCPGRTIEQAEAEEKAKADPKDGASDVKLMYDAGPEEGPLSLPPDTQTEK